jgi:hypothetical protein
MKTIIEYQVATTEGNVNELMQYVNKLIKEGFQPLGGISSTACTDSTICLSQAMVRYAD